MKTTTSALLLCGTLFSQITAFTLNQQPHQQQVIASNPTRWKTAPDSGSSSKPPYRDALLSLHKALIDIPSTLGGGSEDEVARFLARYLNKLGYGTRLQLVPPRDDDDASPETKRFNVIAWPHANSKSISSRKPRLLVSSHLDVVPPFIPYSIDAETPEDIGPDTIISGRGSVDAKASVVAQITAVEALLASGEVDAKDIMLLYVIGEETTGDGMIHFSNTRRKEDPDAEFAAAIFGEPTENKLACGHKGITVGSLYAKGVAGHSGYPDLGKSATAVLTRALVRILDADLGSSERYGNTTFNIGRLAGGVAANVIAKDASATISARIAVGNYSTGLPIVREKIEKILKEVDEEAFTLTLDYGYGPVECNCDVPGFDTMVANYGTDVSNLKGKHTSYLYGPGSILVAHGDNEAITVRDLEDSVEGIKKIIKHALSK